MNRAIRNQDWSIDDTQHLGWDTAAVGVLMDIREELRILNGRLSCRDFLGISTLLQRIARNTAKKKRPKPKLLTPKQIDKAWVKAATKRRRP